MRRVIPVLFAVAVLAAACSRTPRLDTRTFELQDINGGEAATMISPYVYVDRPGAPGQMSHTDQTLTVRETPDNLEKIARVLQEYDKPKPTVRLHFQIIQADGASTTDTAIAPIEAQLRKLFRFKGYTLLSQVVVGGSENSRIVQAVPTSKSLPLSLQAHIGHIRTTADTGVVHLTIGLQVMGGPTMFQTDLNARNGQTVVVGNVQLTEREGGTLILTVRPELVTN